MREGTFVEFNDSKMLNVSNLVDAPPHPNPTTHCVNFCTRYDVQDKLAKNTEIGKDLY